METNVACVEVSAWQGEFERALQLKGRSQNTITSYVRAVAGFAAWFEQQNGQAFAPALLNTWDLRTWRTWCLEVQRVSAATWNLRRSALATFCWWARKTGQISYDPMEDIALVQAEEEQPRWLDKAEFGRLMRQLELQINAANTPRRKELAIRDAAMVGMMIHAGLRDSEVLGLRPEDVVLSERKGEVLVRLAKGQKFRKVPVNVDLRRLLQAWLAVRGEGETLFGVETRAAVERRVAQLGVAARIEGLTPHQLRHTFAKRMCDAGTSLPVVQRLMGHARLETTQRYILAGWEDCEAAVETIGLGKMAKKGA